MSSELPNLDFDRLQAEMADREPSRYVVGIDLGTTNCAVCYLDSEHPARGIQTLPIPQLVAPGQVEERETLPSFHYQPTEAELAGGVLRLPWESQDPRATTGIFAREHGSRVPGRLVVSAKSWLSHAGVDRTSELLPWQSGSDVERLSPVAVSSCYLSHLRQAWDRRFPRHPLAEQEVVLTLPASFDEVARELTVAAAAEAGLHRVVLIEEPQAAFYAWIDRQGDAWDQVVHADQKILVCDIGGGTSDFTLILVKPAGAGDAGQGRVQFHRVAVGEHLILGGDNLDLALAQELERRLADGGKLNPRQWDVLWRQCRHVKEQLLGDHAPESLTVNVPGAGSRLIGGGLQVEVTRDEVRQLLLDGFFPRVPWGDEPHKSRSGFQEFGLPYASDAAITRYLASFLRTHRTAGYQASDGPETRSSPGAADQWARPDIILFNGGLFASPAIRERLLAVLSSWFNPPDSEAWVPQVLDHERLDLAVARGAAYYGMVRRGQGVRIAAGLARSYYVGVDVNQDEPSALCLVPAGVEPGTDIELPRAFRLRVATPVEFPLYVSSVRLTDPPDSLVALDPEQLKALPPIRTVLQTSRREGRSEVTVRLHARISEIGTLILWCREVEGTRRWQLQFDVRAATQTDVASHTGEGEQLGVLDEETWENCQEIVTNVFGEGGAGKPEGLMKELGRVLGRDRNRWPPTVLRRLWELLMDQRDGRKKSAAHEARWINLLGFSLRPGYGLAVDDWRVSETWRLIQGKLVHGSAACRAESWVLWRRIAGGLNANQQQALADPLLGSVRQLHRRLLQASGKKKGFDFSAHEAAEVWRLLGSLERLPLRSKIELGNMLVEMLPKRKAEPMRDGILWAVARVGARVPVYGLLNHVVPVDVVSRWLATLLPALRGESIDRFAVMQLARRTDDRYRDIEPDLQRQLIDWLEDHDGDDATLQLIQQVAALDEERQKQVFGEAMPFGLRIH